MPSYDALLWSVIATALLFDFVNGWNDSANAIATVVGTRVLSPIKAVLLAATLNMAGAFMGQAVAKAVAGEIVDTELISQTVLVAAMSGAIIWAAWMTLIGMPISGSHSLLGGFLGAAVAKAGIQVVKTKGVVTILMAMLVSPILGFILTYILFIIIARLFARRPPGPTGRMFGRLQLVSVSTMSLMHGANDAQKVMGIITLGLLLGGHQDTLSVAPWVVVACGLAISLGTAVGGWKVIKTLGHGLSRLKPVDGFAAETAASVVLYLAKSIGIPVSTTHTITGCILGVGATKGVNSVRWGLGQKILLAWIFTLPSAMVMGGAMYWILFAGFGLDHQPKPPWNVETHVRADGKVELEWPMVKDATSYQLYRYERIDAETEANERVKAAKSKKHRYFLRVSESEELVGKDLTKNSFVDESAKPNHRYVYRIRATNEHGHSRKSTREYPVTTTLGGEQEQSPDSPEED